MINVFLEYLSSMTLWDLGLFAIMIIILIALLQNIDD